MERLGAFYVDILNWKRTKYSLWIKWSRWKQAKLPPLGRRTTRSDSGAAISSRKNNGLMWYAYFFKNYAGENGIDDWNWSSCSRRHLVSTRPRHFPHIRQSIHLLREHFGEQIISHFGPVDWPPRSCDITPLNFFLWGYVKSKVYADNPASIQALEQNITRVIR